MNRIYGDVSSLRHISFFIYIHYNTVYTHPTSSGNKHIPSGGSAGQILRWSSDGTAVWGSDNNTTYGTGTSSASGLTKLYGGTGSATDGTMTQSAITSALNGKAASNHTHSTSAITNLDANLKQVNSVLTEYKSNSEIDSYSAGYIGSFNQVFGHSDVFNSRNYGFWTTISNVYAPSGNAGSQIAISNNGGVATRFYVSNSWSPWKTMFDSLIAIGDYSNLDDYYYPGVYQLSADHYKNCPCHWGTLLVMSCSDGGHTAQLIIDTDGTLHTRNGTKNNTTGNVRQWSAWHKHMTYQTKAHE